MTEFTTEVLSDAAAIAAIASQWDALVREDPLACQGLDATSTWCWFDALVASFPAAASARVVTVRADGALVGLLPLVEVARSLFGSELLVATDLSGGRNGLILAQGAEPAVLQALIKGVSQAYPGWATLNFTMQAQTQDAALFSAGCQALGCALRSYSTAASPYFPLRASEEEFRQGVSKSVLQTLRTSRNKASKLGELSYRVFDSAADAPELLEAVLDIERQSWKHEAGTAITVQPQQLAFYRALFPRALQQGLMLALVLYLDGRPIAHNFGLLRGQVFSCLKHSNVSEHDKLSPSYLVAAELFDRLRARGIQTFDFMGLPEPHKLRWSADNGFYHRECFTAYNANWRGRGLAAARRLKALLKRPAAPAKPDPEGPESSSS